MIKDVLLFLPKGFSNKKTGFIKGFFRDFPNFRAYYVLGSQAEAYSSCTTYIGYVGDALSDVFLGENTIYIKRGSQNITLNNQNGDHNVTEILYDLNELKNNNDINPNESYDYGAPIQELIHAFTKSETQTNRCANVIFIKIIYLFNLFIKVFSRLKSVTKNCALLAHVESNINSLLWFTRTLQRDERLTTTVTHFLVAKIVDILLGVGLFYLCSKHKNLIMSQFHYMAQDFVTHLRELLIYLMGSPIGLKLNYAFNHSLGKFFFYHINLWQVFLQTMEPLLNAYFNMMLFPALMGLSFQIAVLCDIISLSTFHVYCIYVYAARLFLMQIRSIVSLWRLFIGKKFNPLRVRVDSCEYSSNQLFVGTLGFTILLFLLPTTAMYYTVFATFRLLTLIAFTLLNKLKYVCVICVPFCLAASWIFRSSSVAGNICLELKTTTVKQAQVEAKLIPLPIGQSVKKLSSVLKYNNTNLEVGIGSIFWRLCTGQLV